MPTETVLDILKTAELHLEGEFIYGSNNTFLVKARPEGGEPLLAVYKPLSGERILWDFPANTLAHREVAAFLVSQALGWQLVPPTVFRKEAPFGAGSIQLFIAHDPQHHYFNFSEEELQALRPVVLFDLLVNNADRKGGHILFDGDGHLWLIDHGLCFNAEAKLRTVIWDFAGEPIPNELQKDVGQFRSQLLRPSGLKKALQEHLAPDEITALANRASNLIQLTHFPFPPNHRRAFPFPPV